MTLRHFRIFIEVASAGSITQAARNLYLTQPTVSTAVRELEEHYGTLFFDRINQRLRITGEGRRFLDYARHFIQMYDEMELAFSNSGISGVLRIGASTNVGISYLPRFMQLFQETYPQVHTQVHIQTTAQTEAMLLNGALDLAIVGGTIRSEQIALTPLFQEHYTAICAPGHPMAGKTVSINTFMKQPLLFREVGSTSYEVFQNAIRQTGCEVTPAWESTSQEAILEAVRLGLGVTILPSAMLEAELRLSTISGSIFRIFLFKIPFIWRGIKASFCLLSCRILSKWRVNFCHPTIFPLKIPRESLPMHILSTEIFRRTLPQLRSLICDIELPWEKFRNASVLYQMPLRHFLANAFFSALLEPGSGLEDMILQMKGIALEYAIVRYSLFL